MEYYNIYESACRTFMHHWKFVSIINYLRSLGCHNYPLLKIIGRRASSGALSPCLIAIFIDSVINKIICCDKGCHLASRCVSNILYADDILLVSPSVTSLQSMFNICDEELQSLNMYINPSKSAYMRIGPHCKQACMCITTNEVILISWCDTCRYLGVYLTCAKKIQANFDHAKSNFYRFLTALWPRLVVQHHTMSWFSYFVPSVCQFFFTAQRPAILLTK